MVTRKPRVTKKATTTKRPAKRAAAKKSAPAAALEPSMPPPILDALEPEAARVPDGPQPKLIRDSFTMPKPEYEQIAALKARLLGLTMSLKKSELLRAGIVALSSMSDGDLIAAVGRIPCLKTGRPRKHAAKPGKKRP